MTRSKLFRAVVAEIKFGEVPVLVGIGGAAYITDVIVRKLDAGHPLIAVKQQQAGYLVVAERAGVVEGGVNIKEV